MDDKNISTLIKKGLLGLLSAEEQQQLDSYLNERPQMKEEFQSFRDSIPENYERYKQYKGERIENVLKDYKKRHIRKMAIYIVSTAACLALLFALAVGWYQDYNRTEPPVLSADVQQTIIMSKQSHRQDAVITTVTNEEEYKDIIDIDEEEGLNANALLNSYKVTTYHDKEFWLTLDDGTVVHLNNDTRLIYPQKFGSKKREVYLEGEAYFAVARNSHRPFIVHTPHGSVIEHGTEFNINTKNEEDETVVVLVDGCVSVKSNHGEERTLKPSEMAQLKSDGLSIEPVDVEPYVAWNTGTFDFRDVSLEKIMDVLSRWHGKKVVFKSEELRHHTFYGHIRRYDQLEPALKAIMATTNIRITLEGDTIEVSE